MTTKTTVVKEWYFWSWHPVEPIVTDWKAIAAKANAKWEAEQKALPNGGWDI